MLCIFRDELRIFSETWNVLRHTCMTVNDYTCTTRIIFLLVSCLLYFFPDFFEEISSFNEFDAMSTLLDEVNEDRHFSIIDRSDYCILKEADIRS